MKKTLLTLCALALISCGTAPRRLYKVTQDFNIIVEDAHHLRKLYHQYDKNTDVWGFYDVNTNPITIHVPYCDDLPCFKTLGHEIWHLKELGGRFHK